MGKLETATPRFGFTLGFLLLGFFPSDLICSIVIGTHLANHSDPWWHALPFVFLTLFLLGLPALMASALGQRAETVLPKIRDWMNKTRGSSARSSWCSSSSSSWARVQSAWPATKRRGAGTKPTGRSQT